jgi:lipopolysaccharide export system protein LptA
VKRALIAACFVLCCAAFPLRAETITFSADRMSGYSGDKTDYTVLSGNAVVKTDKIELKADSIELSGEDFRFIAASGTVKGKNTEQDMDFSCDSFKYDRETEVVTLKSNADISDNPNEVTAKAQLIEYNQKTNVATMQIGVELRQKDSVCTSAFAIYRKDQQMLEMTGNPNIKKKDDTFRAREITMNLDTEEIQLDGRVRGSVSASGGGDKKKAETEAGESGNSATGAPGGGENTDASDSDADTTDANAADDAENNAPATGETE